MTKNQANIIHKLNGNSAQFNGAGARLKILNNKEAFSKFNFKLQISKPLIYPLGIEEPKANTEKPRYIKGVLGTVRRIVDYYLLSYHHLWSFKYI